MGEQERLLAQLEEKVEWIELAERSLAECQADLKATADRLEQLELLVRAITGSRSWQLAQHIGQIGRRFAPSGTRRHRLFRGATRCDPPAASAPIIHVRGQESSSDSRVLVIDYRLPSPDRDAGSLRMVEIVRAILDRGYRVSFIPDNLLVWPPYFQDLQRMGVEVVCRPEFDSIAQYLKRNGPSFQLAIICRVEIAAQHMTTVRRLAPQAKIVFDTVDLHFVREERHAQLTHDESLVAAAAERKRTELRLAMRADLTIVVSPIEKKILERECPEIDVRIIPTMYPTETRDPPGWESRRDIVFIGGFAHAPNVDAVLYFVDAIFPLVRDRVPEAIFKVIGSDPPPEIQRLAGPHVEILGHVPDVRPIFDRARLSVAPLRFGAGVKGKVNQSMSLGVPTVVTAIAAEGMYLVHGQDAMVADDAESFADCVVQLWSRPELWNTVSANGRCSFREHFSVEAATPYIDELLEWAGLSPVTAGDRRTVPAAVG